MILDIIFWFFIYFLLIFLLHNLYLFLEKHLTTTKIKDLYNEPNNEYKKIYKLLDNKYINEINSNNLDKINENKVDNNNIDNNNIDNNNIDDNNIDDNMKSELKDFLMNLSS